MISTLQNHKLHVLNLLNDIEKIIMLIIIYLIKPLIKHLRNFIELLVLNFFCFF